MAYSTPPTFVASDPLAAAELNVLGDDIVYLKGITDGLTFSAVKTTRAGTTSISDDTWTPISFTAEVLDYGGWYSSGTDIIVPAGAVPAGFTTIAVLVLYAAAFSPDAAGFRSIHVLVNGSDVGLAGTQPGFASDNAVISTAGVIIVEAADVITLETYQNSGGSLNTGSYAITCIRLSPVA